MPLEFHRQCGGGLKSCLLDHIGSTAEACIKTCIGDRPVYLGGGPMAAIALPQSSFARRARPQMPSALAVSWPTSFRGGDPLSALRTSTRAGTRYALLSSPSTHPSSGVLLWLLSLDLSRTTPWTRTASCKPSAFTSSARLIRTRRRLGRPIGPRPESPSRAFLVADKVIVLALKRPSLIRTRGGIPRPGWGGVRPPVAGGVDGTWKMFVSKKRGAVSAERPAAIYMARRTRCLAVVADLPCQSPRRAQRSRASIVERHGRRSGQVQRLRDVPAPQGQGESAPPSRCRRQLRPRQCTNERPLCGNCVNSGRQCEGYERQRVFITGTPETMGRVASHPKRTGSANKPKSEPAAAPEGAWDDSKPQLVPTESLAMAWGDAVALSGQGIVPSAPSTGLQTDLCSVLKQGDADNSGFAVLMPANAASEPQAHAEGVELDAIPLRGDDAHGPTGGYCTPLYEAGPSRSAAVTHRLMSTQQASSSAVSSMLAALGESSSRETNLVERLGPDSFASFPNHQYFARIYQPLAVSGESTASK